MDATELALMRSNEPFEMPYLKIMGTEQAFNWVLDNAGATIPCRDIVDPRIMDEVRTGVEYTTSTECFLITEVDISNRRKAEPSLE